MTPQPRRGKLRSGRSAKKVAPRPLERAQSTRVLTVAAQNRIDRFVNFAVRVARSPIHRLGVYAAEDIPSRKRVIEYLGRKLNARQTDATFEKRRAGRSPDLFYLVYVNKNLVLDGAIGGSGAEYINHCCEPNLNLSKIGLQIFLISKRKIASGEELSYDYRFSHEALRVECSCGARKCRGTINLHAPKKKKKKKKKKR
jgi:uncharacterized protein